MICVKFLVTFLIYVSAANSGKGGTFALKVFSAKKKFQSIRVGAISAKSEIFQLSTYRSGMS